jgi:hypothetical protein
MRMTMVPKLFMGFYPDQLSQLLSIAQLETLDEARRRTIVTVTLAIAYPRAANPYKVPSPVY